jgi:hypothetical protein
MKSNYRLTVLCFSLNAENKDTHSKNNVYVECLGNGLLYSFNYEYMPQDNFSARIGAGYLADTETSVALIPVMGNYLMRESSHRFELGAGATIILIDGKGEYMKQKASAAIPTLTAGYRYQPREGGMIFRAGFTPLFGKDTFVPSVGLSIGQSF